MLTVKGKNVGEIQLEAKWTSEFQKWYKKTLRLLDQSSG